MTLFSSKSFPLISAWPQKPQKLTASKIRDEKFGHNTVDFFANSHAVLANIKGLERF